MTRLEEIERAVEALSPADLAEFRAWFEAFDQAEASGGLAELERRWDRVANGDVETASQEEIERWLRTWGAKNFRPWRER